VSTPDADAAATTLTPAQLATVLDALADAADYRRACADHYCSDCEVFEEASGQRCGQHLDDLGAAQAYDDLSAVLEPGGSAPLIGGDEDDEEEGQSRNRMACGDSLWDEEKYAEGAAMHCPRHGATSAITEEQWLSEHPAEPIGFLAGEEAGDEPGGGAQ
jgi:hypothetical protein